MAVQVCYMDTCFFCLGCYKGTSFGSDNPAGNKVQKIQEIAPKKLDVKEDWIIFFFASLPYEHELKYQKLIC